jgi:DNA-binding NarL/FixJ family response regulator
MGDMGNTGVNSKLTKRELQIVKLIARGMSDPEIAVALKIKVSCVISHNQNLYKKLAKPRLPTGKNQRCSAVAAAILEGYVGMQDFCEQAQNYSAAQMDLLEGVEALA